MTAAHKFLILLNFPLIAKLALWALGARGISTQGWGLWEPGSLCISLEAAQFMQEFVFHTSPHQPRGDCSNPPARDGQSLEKGEKCENGKKKNGEKGADFSTGSTGCIKPHNFFLESENSLISAQVFSNQAKPHSDWLVFIWCIPE